MTQELQTTKGAEARAAAAYIASLGTAVSKRVMTQELRKVAQLMGAGDWQQVPWSTLNAANVRAIMAKVEGAPASRRKTLAALKGVARMAYELQQIDADTYTRITLIKGDKGHREPKGRNVEAWELAALMRVCAKDLSPAGARDAALIAVAAKTGARRAELASMPYSSVLRADEGIEIRTIGKGNKERMLYVDNGALLALNDWLQIRGNADGPLFCAINQKGILDPEHEITPTGLHKILLKRAAEAELSEITWHDFRRTFASTLLDAGADISVVAGLMGHANITTTAGYDRRPEEAKRKAARKISVPYFSRRDADATRSASE
jgi:site-specific recombinase XerD